LFYVTLSLPLTSTLFPYTTLFRSLLHNSLNSVEAKPCSFPHSLRGEERFEDVRPYLGQNPRTVIGDLNHDAIVLAIGSNSKLAFTAHGFNGIVAVVCTNVFNLVNY